ncbi:MAG: hypothetical protein ACOCX4_07240 [Planctomycetota bacterium]
MPWVDISQAAFTMGISERTIRNWIKAGKLNAKTENGQRMVEIPEEELRASAGGGEDASFADSEFFEDGEGDGEGGRMLGTQKRLEVALLECGRVKGTLASQERIMETLSSNIAELTAKLQKSQNRSWKLIMLALGIAFLGVVAILARNSLHKDDLASMRKEHREELDAVATKKTEVETRLHEERTENLQKQLELRNQYDKGLEAKVADAKQELKQLWQADIDRLREDHKRTLDEKNALIEQLRNTNKELETKAIRLEEQEKSLKSDIAKLEDTLGSQARQLEKLEEYKTRIIELQDDLDKSRRRGAGE